MNLIKHLEFFDPTQVKEQIHIIGCGAIGSCVAEQLVRLGFNKLILYDFDTVNEHNITNQMYRPMDVGKLKVDSLKEILQEINPEVQITTRPKGWTELTPLAGIVVLAVDNIELRHKIATLNKTNKQIKYVTDCRMELTSAQCYAADWNNNSEVKNIIESMNFTSEEAKAAVPVSACGTTLSVTPTVRTITSLCVSNMINFLKHTTYKTLIIMDAFYFNLITFPM